MKRPALALVLFTLAALPSQAAALPQSLTASGTWRARLEDTWTRSDGRLWVSLQLVQDDDLSRYIL